MKAGRLSGQAADLTEASEPTEKNSNQDKIKPTEGDVQVEKPKSLEEASSRNIPKCLELSTSTQETQSPSNTGKSKPNSQSNAKVKREESAGVNCEFNLEEAFPSLPEPTSSLVLNQSGGFFGSYSRQKTVSETVNDRTTIVNSSSPNANRADVIT